MAFWLTQALFVLGVLFLISLLECDDPSTVDDSIIPFALALLGLLGAVLLGLLLADAPPLPCASALLPPLVIFALPWRDVHSAAALTWAWLAGHVCVLGWTLFRRPNKPRKRRAARESNRAVEVETRRNLRRNWVGFLYHFASPAMQSWWAGGDPPGPQGPQTVAREDSRSPLDGAALASLEAPATQPIAALDAGPRVARALGCGPIEGRDGIDVSFVELMCGYFDDLNLSDGLDAAVRDGWMSAAEARASTDFHCRAESYRAPSSAPSAVLADPAWADVVEAARQAWFGVRAIVDDAETLSEMDALEARWGRIAPANKPQEPTNRDQCDGES